MRTIKFKRAYFFDEELKHFSHYSEWGVKIKGAEFTSPSSNNYAPFFTDYQFTGLHDKNGKEIYEGDLIETDVIGIAKITYGNSSKFPCSFCWEQKYAMYYLDKEIATASEIIGNIHETPDLI